MYLNFPVKVPENQSKTGFLYLLPMQNQFHHPFFPPVHCLSAAGPDPAVDLQHIPRDGGEPPGPQKQVAAGSDGTVAGPAGDFIGTHQPGHRGRSLGPF